MYPVLQWAHSRKAGAMGGGEEREVTVNSEYRDSLGKDGEEKEAVWWLLKEEGRKGRCETRHVLRRHVTLLHWPVLLFVCFLF